MLYQSYNVDDDGTEDLVIKIKQQKCKTHIKKYKNSVLKSNSTFIHNCQTQKSAILIKFFFKHFFKHEL